MGRCRQNVAVLPSLVYSYSQVFCSTVLLKFLKWTPELSQSCICQWIDDELLIFLEVMEAAILVMSFWIIFSNSLEDALPLPQPKSLVFTGFFLNILFILAYISLR